LKNKLPITSGIKYWGFINMPSALVAGKLFYQLIGKRSRTPQHSIPQPLAVIIKNEEQSNHIFN